MRAHAPLILLGLLTACGGTDGSADAGGRDSGVDGGRDAAALDAATVDGGADAGDCPSSCEEECSTPDVCVVDAAGCHACGPCPRCNPFRCETACAIDPESGECGCAGTPPLVEGDRCGWTTPPCEPELECLEGLCFRRCADHEDCVGSFPQCTEGRCDLRRGSEWTACTIDGDCEEGLECTSAGCRRRCDHDGDCTQAYPTCSDGECAPVTGCDAVHDTGCASGLTCRLSMGDAGGADGVCFEPAATVPGGAHCERETAGVCAAGHECVAGGAGHRCYRLCYADASGEACGRCVALTASTGEPLSHHGREVGVCL